MNCFSQINFNNPPKNKQLFARNLLTNLATITFSGTVINAGTPYTEIRLKVYRNDIFQTTVNQTLIYTGGIANFAFNYNILAELANYKFQVYGVNGVSEILVKTVADLVAGDVYIINGQSNADAPSYNGSANTYKNNFVRAYGSSYTAAYAKKWYSAKGDGGSYLPGGTGQWGLVVGNKIVNDFNIPVAIFNGAEGGQIIEYFQRNDLNPLDPATNYGRLLTRLQETNLQNGVRGIFWYQGESNAFGMTTETYKSYFNELNNDWQVDFPNIEHEYIFQIRKGCGQEENKTLKIQEAQRQLALEIPYLHIMATNGAEHYVDDCHFPFINGYEFHGLNIYRLVARDLYGATEELNSKPPTVMNANLVVSNQIVLTLETVTDTYTWEAGSENDFNLVGTTAEVISGNISGNTIILNLSADASTIESINYVGHNGAATPFPKNANGIGLLSFKNFAVDNLLRKQEINNAISIYPNPVVDHLVITNAGSNKINDLVIKDVSGRSIVIEKKMDDINIIIDLSEYASGFYFIQYECEGIINVNKFVKR